MGWAEFVLAAWAFSFLQRGTEPFFQGWAKLRWGLILWRLVFCSGGCSDLFCNGSSRLPSPPPEPWPTIALLCENLVGTHMSVLLWTLPFSPSIHFAYRSKSPDKTQPTFYDHKIFHVRAFTLFSAFWLLQIILHCWTSHMFCELVLL